MEIHFFDTHIEKFIQSLEPQTIAKVLRTIDLLEQFGFLLTMPHSRPIGQNLFELRIRGVQEVRLFYTFQNSAAVVLHGYKKKSQRLSTQEVRLAEKRKRRLDGV